MSGTETFLLKFGADFSDIIRGIQQVGAEAAAQANRAANVPLPQIQLPNFNTISSPTQARQAGEFLGSAKAAVRPYAMQSAGVTDFDKLDAGSQIRVLDMEKKLQREINSLRGSLQYQGRTNPLAAQAAQEFKLGTTAGKNAVDKAFSDGAVIIKAQNQKLQEQKDADQAAFDASLAELHRKRDIRKNSNALEQKQYNEALKTDTDLIAQDRLTRNRIARQANIKYHNTINGGDFSEIVDERLGVQRTQRQIFDQYYKRVQDPKSTEIEDEGKSAAIKQSYNTQLAAVKERELNQDRKFIEARAVEISQQGQQNAQIQGKLANDHKYNTALAKTTLAMAQQEVQQKLILSGTNQYGRTLANAATSQAVINADKQAALAGNQFYIGALEAEAVSRQQIAGQLQTQLATNGLYQAALAKESIARQSTAAQQQQRLAGDATYIANRAAETIAIADATAKTRAILAGDNKYIESLAEATAANKAIAAKSNIALSVIQDPIANALQGAGRVASEKIKRGEEDAYIRQINNAQAAAAAKGLSGPIDDAGATAAGLASIRQQEIAVEKRILATDDLYLAALAEDVVQTQAIATQKSAILAADAAYIESAAIGAALNKEINARKIIESTTPTEKARINAAANAEKDPLKRQRLLDNEAALITERQTREAQIFKLKNRTILDLNAEASQNVLERAQRAQIASLESKMMSQTPELIKARAETIVNERRYALQLRKAVTEEAQRQGVGGRGPIARLLARFGGGSGNPNDFGASGAIPQTAGQFLGRGAANVARFAIPSALAFGGFNLLKEGITSAAALEREFALVKTQFDATFGAESDSIFKAFKGNVFSIARESGVAAEEIAHVGFQLQAAFKDAKGIQKTLPGGGRVEVTGQNLFNAQLEDAAKIAVVTGLSAKEINDSMTAASIGLKRTFGDIGDVTVKLQDKFGVLAKEIIPFLGDIAPVAADAGFELEDLAALAAVVQQKSGRSGAALAENFGRILPQITLAKNELLELGEANESAFGTVGLSKYLAAVGRGDTKSLFFELAKVFDTLNKSSQDFVINLLGGRRESAAILSAFKGGGLDAAKAALADGAAVGTLEERYKQVSKTLSVEFNKMKETFKQLSIAIAQAGLLDALKAIVSSLKEFADVMIPVIKVVGEFLTVLDGAPVKFLAWSAAILLVVKSMKALQAVSAQSAILNVLTGGKLGAAASTAAAGSGAANAAGAGGLLASAGRALYTSKAAAATNAAFLAKTGATLGPTSAGLTGLGTVAIPAAIIFASAYGIHKYIQSREAKARAEYDKKVNEELKNLQDKDYDELSKALNTKVGDSNFAANISEKDLLALSKGVSYDGKFGQLLDPKTKAIAQEFLAKKFKKDFGAIGDAIGRDSEQFAQDIKNNPALLKAIGEAFGVGKTKTQDAELAGLPTPDLSKDYAAYAEKNLTPEKIAQAYNDAENATGKKQENARKLLLILVQYGDDLDTLTGTAAEKASASANLSFAQALTKYDSGTLDIGTVRKELAESLEKGRIAIEAALNPKQTAPIDIDPGAADDLIAGQGKKILDELDIEKKEVQVLKSEYDAGLISFGTYVTLMKESIAQQQKNIDDLKKNGQGVPRELYINIANDTATVQKAYADHADKYADYISEITSLSGGDVEQSIEGLQQVIDGALARLKDPEYKDKGARLNATKKIFAALEKQRQIEANAATSVEERNRILAEERPLDPEILKIAAGELVDTSPEFDNFVTLLQAFGKGVEAENYRNIAILVLTKQITAEEALRGLKVQEAYLATIIATTGDNAVIEEYQKIAALVAQFEALVNNNAKYLKTTISFKPGSSSGSNAADEYADALAEWLLALVEGDPIASAKQSIQNAQDAYARAETAADRLKAQTAELRARRSLSDAIKELSDSEYELMTAWLVYFDKPAEVTQLALKKANEDYKALLEKQATVGGVSQAQINNALTTIVNTQRAVYDQEFQAKLDTIQFEYDMGKITKEQFIKRLELLLQIPTNTLEQNRNLQRTIKGLQDDVGKSGDLQFNLPTKLGLPTLYEARRINQAGGTQAGYVDNRNVNITLYVTNGMTQQQAVSLITDAAGSNRVAFTSKRY